MYSLDGILLCVTTSVSERTPSMKPIYVTDGRGNEVNMPEHQKEIMAKMFLGMKVSMIKHDIETIDKMRQKPSGKKRSGKKRYSGIPADNYWDEIIMKLEQMDRYIVLDPELNIPLTYAYVNGANGERVPKNDEWEQIKKEILDFVNRYDNGA